MPEQVSTMLMNVALPGAEQITLAYYVHIIKHVL